MELVRYIHLNPLRAGLVVDLGALDRYPCTGYSVIMGKGVMEGQVVNDLLSLFSSKSGNQLALQICRCVKGVPDYETMR
jgi:hypothetical protein